eukprot:gnl/TRDRNA2_/TRDRNA2_180129_c0_seq1.p1 gnl/TRDRNA2_/TRDRNA2_180129_c0~~gnl/TRDRNA2_/TRDRNA2_180129_c0_seq1.p1  ORF type:complete len:178 (+),score=47.09 gnl/TRDRNA2_/TRDRNA2_180129_c0_seq1:79-612(+)
MMMRLPVLAILLAAGHLTVTAGLEHKPATFVDDPAIARRRLAAKVAKVFRDLEAKHAAEQPPLALVTQTAPEAPPPACVSIASAGGSVDGALEGKIDEKVGAEMGQTYLTLANKREQIVNQLKDMCADEKTQRDPTKRAQIRADIEKMAAIKEQVDEHFGTVSALFGGGFGGGMFGA